MLLQAEAIQYMPSRCIRVIALWWGALGKFVRLAKEMPVDENERAPVSFAELMVPSLCEWKQKDLRSIVHGKWKRNERTTPFFFFTDEARDVVVSHRKSVRSILEESVTRQGNACLVKFWCRKKKKKGAMMTEWIWDSRKLEHFLHTNVQLGGKRTDTVCGVVLCCRRRWLAFLFCFSVLRKEKKNGKKKRLQQVRNTLRGIQIYSGAVKRSHRLLQTGIRHTAIRFFFYTPVSFLDEV